VQWDAQARVNAEAWQRQEAEAKANFDGWIREQKQAEAEQAKIADQFEKARKDQAARDQQNLAQIASGNANLDPNLYSRDEDYRLAQKDEQLEYWQAEGPKVIEQAGRTRSLEKDAERAVQDAEKRLRTAQQAIDYFKKHPDERLAAKTLDALQIAYSDLNYARDERDKYQGELDYLPKRLAAIDAKIDGIQAERSRLIDDNTPPELMTDEERLPHPEKGLNEVSTVKTLEASKKYSGIVRDISTVLNGTAEESRATKALESLTSTLGSALETAKSIVEFGEKIHTIQELRDHLERTIKLGESGLAFKRAADALNQEAVRTNDPVRRAQLWKLAGKLNRADQESMNELQAMTREGLHKIGEDAQKVWEELLKEYFKGKR
jgi:hypothetical protein